MPVVVVAPWRSWWRTFSDLAGAIPLELSANDLLRGIIIVVVTVHQGQKPCFWALGCTALVLGIGALT